MTPVTEHERLTLPISVLRARLKSAEANARHHRTAQQQHEGAAWISATKARSNEQEAAQLTRAIELLESPQ